MNNPDHEILISSVEPIDEPLDADERAAELAAAPDDDFEPAQTKQDEGYKALQAATLDRTREYFASVGLSEDLIVPYAAALAADVEQELRKFAIGHLKHGGDILVDRNLLEELDQELVDAKIYLRCLRIKRSHINVYV